MANGSRCYSPAISPAAKRPRDQAFSPGWCLPHWTQAFPDHELIELPDAKHYIQEDAPHEIAAAITQRFG